MGADISLPGRAGESVRPESVKTFLNTIMYQMFRRIDLVDLYSLADPERCKSYVVVTATTLEKLFAKKQLYLKKGKDGTFFFQKLRAIQSQNPLGQDLQQQHCQDLAFYFIRVFQIFAAVALTVLDMDVREEDISVLSKGATIQRGPIVHTTPIPGFQQPRGESSTGLVGTFLRGFFGGGNTESVTQTGGALLRTLATSSTRQWADFTSYAGIHEADPYYKLLNNYLELLDNFSSKNTGPLYFTGYTSIGSTIDKGILTIDQAGIYKLRDEVLQNIQQAAAAGTSPVPFQRAPSTYPAPSPGVPAFPGGREALSPTGLDPDLDLSRPGLRQRRVPYVPNGPEGLEPEILYRFKRYDTPVKMRAKLLFSKMDDDFFIQVKEVYIDTKLVSQDPYPTQPVRLTTDLDPVKPKDSAGNEIPKVIVNQLVELYISKVGPIPLSAIQFLRNFKILTGTIDSDRPTVIDGTSVEIPNPKSQLPLQEIDIRYRGEVPAQGRKERVLIYAQLSVKERKRIVTEPNAYDVSVRITGVEPSDLGSYFQIPGPRSVKFSSRYGGSSDLVTDQGKTFKEYIQSYFKNFLERGAEGGIEGGIREGAITYTKEDRVPVPVNTSKLPDTFQIKRYWEGLRSRPPVKAHCVARALQLLNANAILDGRAGTGTSRVCNVNFIYIQNDSLPDPKGTIDSETSVAATRLLFFDKVIGQMPAIANQEQYRRFSRQMRQAFERYKTLEQTPVTGNIREVRERYMPFCEGKESSDIYIKDAAVVAKLRSTAKELIQRQMRHVSGAMRILTRLFDKKSVDAGLLELHPRVMQGGTDELNAIAKDARELLVDYYSDCEQTYKEGLITLYSEMVKPNREERFQFVEGQKVVVRRASDRGAGASTTADDDNNYKRRD